MDYIHRDIKPGNVVFMKPDDFLSVKLIDFGLSRRLKTDQFEHADDNWGTLVYQPPE